MNIIDYIFEDDKQALVFDEKDNLYIYYNKCTSDRVFEFLGLLKYSLLKYSVEINGKDVGYIEASVYKELSKYEVVVTKSDDIDVSDVRRPYYRMRGKPVSKEQAFDIIRRSDKFFTYVYEIRYNSDFVNCVNFNNWLIEKNHYPYGYGWIHVDGTVGCNAITQKYPEIEEFIVEWFEKLMAFPYLDLIIAITDWNEVNPRWWCSECGSVEEYEAEEYDSEFYDAITMGIYVHDNKLEILDREDTVQKYKEYDSMYGQEREKFESHYYGRNNIEQVDIEYLRRCIESYGLGADEVLSKIPEYVWKR